jgi:plasmid stabilization system protein ParE
MTLPVVLREEAESEFDEAFDYYEKHRSGLGADFAACVQDVFDRISAFPTLHVIVLGDVRRAVVKRFPFCVFYRAEPARVQVLAVFHDRRDPSIWQSRVN